VSQPLTGAPLDRADGRLKVTGGAMYAGDRSPEHLAHGFVIASTVARGRIVSIDARAANAAPGVLAIITHENAPRVNAEKKNASDTKLFLLQNAVVEFDRQPVGLVVAETLEQAQYAASLVKIAYAADTPVMDMHTAQVFRPEKIFDEPAMKQRGQPDAVNAAERVDQTYRTPTEHHNPMETHGTVASWNDGRVTIYDSTQWVFGVRKTIAAAFDIPPENVTVISPFVGGAFGSKGTAWSHVPLAVMASKVTGRPVKLLVNRAQMFGWVGHRPQTEQHVTVAAARDGTLQSVTHDVMSETSLSDEFVEPCAVFSRDLYRTPNYAMSHQLRRLSISKPTYQRGPGESTGSFAMESAMDELSYKLGIDPLQLRLINYSDANPDSQKPYTAKHLRECYELASTRFGWAARDPRVRSTRRGRLLVGTGMASASRATHSGACSVRVTLHADGSLLVQCGTIEQGTGSSTVYGQLAASILDVPFDRVRFEFGDTSLPNAPIAAGSQTASSVGSAVVVASKQLRAQVDAAGGKIPANGFTVALDNKPDEAEEEKFAQQAFGAHFAEVEVDPGIGAVRVTRFTAAFDAGRILNAKTARSQFVGAIVWGISMALFEKTRFDARTGRIMNANFTQYLIPTNADIPDIDVVTVEADDPNANPAGVRGIGEIGISGSAAAVANAVYHATGVRVRSLPITVESLIASS
jgi:xanthine dehydrogenase YagR molybdenum-binding subunit